MQISHAHAPAHITCCAANLCVLQISLHSTAFLWLIHQPLDPAHKIGAGFCSSTFVNGMCFRQITPIPISVRVCVLEWACFGIYMYILAISVPMCTHSMCRCVCVRVDEQWIGFIIMHTIELIKQNNRHYRLSPRTIHLSSSRSCILARSLDRFDSINLIHTLPARILLILNALHAQ